MGRVRDSSVTRDASFLARSCGGVCVAQLMVRQLAQDVDSAEEVELRRLERHPEACRAVAVLAAAWVSGCLVVGVSGWVCVAWHLARHKSLVCTFALQGGGEHFGQKIGWLPAGGDLGEPHRPRRHRVRHVPRC